MITQSMFAVRNVWVNFWFRPVAPTNLAVARIIFFGFLGAFYLPQDFAVWGTVTPALYEPIWLFDRFSVPVFSASILTVLQFIWKLSLILACIGFWTRTSTTIAAALGTYLLGLPHNFGQTYHFDALLVLAFWILAFSHAGDAWSVDSLVAAAHGEEPARRSGEYLWPIQLILTAMSLVFFAAGIAKIWTSGVEWVLSDHMRFLLHRVQYHISDAEPLVNWGSHLAEFPWVPRMLAAGTVVIETCYPLALFSRRLRVPLVLGGISLIVGIRLLMGPTFEQFLVANAFWVPWDRLAERAKAWLPSQTSKTRMTVLYDGACGLCVPTIAVLRRLDLRRAVEFLDVTRDWPSIHRRFPTLSQHACLQDMHGIDGKGRTVSGFDTYRKLAHVLPLGWLLVPILYVPPVPTLGRRVYRAIAHRRQTTACALPPPQTVGSGTTQRNRAPNAG